MAGKTMKGSLKDLAWQHLLLAKEYKALTRYFERQGNIERQFDTQRFHDRHMGAFEELTKDDTNLYQELMIDLQNYGEYERTSFQVKRSDWR